MTMSSTGWAQATASIRGEVLDLTNLPIPGAKVVLENTATSETLTLFTNDRGEYRFEKVSPGTYDVKAEHNGFKTVVYKDVPLLVNTPRNLPLKFVAFGPITATVEVSAQGVPNINSVDASIGNTIESSQITALPIEGRSFE